MWEQQSGPKQSLPQCSERRQSAGREVAQSQLVVHNFSKKMENYSYVLNSPAKEKVSSHFHNQNDKNNTHQKKNKDSGSRYQNSNIKLLNRNISNIVNYNIQN